MCIKNISFQVLNHDRRRGASHNMQAMCKIACKQEDVSQGRINRAGQCFVRACVCSTSDCGYSPSGNGAFCEPVELPLLRRLLSLLTDKLDFNFLCILCDTGVDSCLLGWSVFVSAGLVPGPDPDPDPSLLPPQEHTRVAPAPPVPPSAPLQLLNMGVSAPASWKRFLSFPTWLFNWDPD